MFESDCWLDWDPDPERAAGQADPTLEPYASMTKPQILDLMAHAKGGREWEFYQEYFLNKCTKDELAVGTGEFIERQYGVFGFEELCFLEGAIELALQRRAGAAREGLAPRREGTEPRFTYPYTVDQEEPSLTPPGASPALIKMTKPVVS